MRIPKTIILFFILCFSINLVAQDRHFTLFNFAPLVINPAYTGAYEGSFRVGGIYRGQSFANNIPTAGTGIVYRTPNVFIDAPLLNVRKKDWVGVGGNIYSDQAGAFDLGYTTIHGSAAYHLALDSKRDNVLTLGVNIGQVVRSTGGNCSEAVYPDADFDPPSSNNNCPYQVMQNDRNLEGPGTSFFDLGAGMLLRSKLNKATNIEVGFSLQHITGNFEFDSVLDSMQNQRSNYNLQIGGANTPYRIPKNFVLHGKYNVDLTEQFSLSPTFLFQQFRVQNEAVLQVWGGYKLLKRETRDDGKKGKIIKDKDAPKVRFGLGYRVGDALQVLFGYEKGDLRVGIGYDLTLSTLADANNNQGGLEIAANYIFRIYKQPEVDPAILCPKF